MGFALPAAIGAKYGAQDKTVVAIIGDGGFQMTLQELGTIMQTGIDVKIIILNNRFLGMVAPMAGNCLMTAVIRLLILKVPIFVAVAAAYRIPVNV